MNYVLIFLVFSVVGWVIDTTYRSIAKGLYSPIRNYPFSPVYGVGAVVLSIFYTHTPYSYLTSICVATVLMVLVELLGGIFSEKVLKKRLWNYSQNRFNFMGHIDLLHSFFWLMLAGLYYWLGGFFPLY